MAGNRLGLEPQILTRQNFAKKGSFSSGWFALHKNLPILLPGVSTYNEFLLQQMYKQTVKQK